MGKISPELISLTIFIPGLLMLSHWLPWKWFTGRDLPPRVFSYTGGVLAVLLPVTLGAWGSDAPLTGEQAIGLVWLGFVSAGAVTVINHAIRALMDRKDRLVSTVAETAARYAGGQGG